jgi:hypothetical protein
MGWLPTFTPRLFVQGLPSHRPNEVFGRSGGLAVSGGVHSFSTPRTFVRRAPLRAARRARLALLVLCGVAIVLGAGGCSDPYAIKAGSVGTGASSVQNVGEPPAPAPRQDGAGGVFDPQATPQAAIARFAEVYANWSYRSLARDQVLLASMSVGAARLAERQAAASTRADGTLARARISNRGSLLSVSADLARAGWWVVVNREQTFGRGEEYEGLAASDHVVLVQVARVGDGWAVSQWLPQD